MSSAGQVQKLQPMQQLAVKVVPDARAAGNFQAAYHTGKTAACEQATALAPSIGLLQNLVAAISIMASHRLPLMQSRLTPSKLSSHTTAK